MQKITLPGLCGKADVPEDFDPRENPILAQHFFGIDPDWRCIRKYHAGLLHDAPIRMVQR